MRQVLTPTPRPPTNVNQESCRSLYPPVRQESAPQQHCAIGVPVRQESAPQQHCATAAPELAQRSVQRPTPDPAANQNGWANQGAVQQNPVSSPPTPLLRVGNVWHSHLEVPCQGSGMVCSAGSVAALGSASAPSFRGCGFDANVGRTPGFAMDRGYVMHRRTSTPRAVVASDGAPATMQIQVGSPQHSTGTLLSTLGAPLHCMSTTAKLQPEAVQERRPTHFMEQFNKDDPRPVSAQSTPAPSEGSSLSAADQFVAQAMATQGTSRLSPSLADERATVTIALDVDEVLCCYVDGFRKFLQRERPHGPLDTDAVFHEAHSPTSEWRLQFALSGGLDTLDAVPGAAAALRRLKAAGVRLEAVTTRPPIMRHSTETLLLKLFPPGTFARAHFVPPGQKGRTCNDIRARALVDDQVPNVADAAACGVLPILFDLCGSYPWIRAWRPEDIPFQVRRIQTWAETCDVLLSAFGLCAKGASPVEGPRFSLRGQQVDGVDTSGSGRLRPLSDEKQRELESRWRERMRTVEKTVQRFEDISNVVATSKKNESPSSGSNSQGATTIDNSEASHDDGRDELLMAENAEPVQETQWSANSDVSFTDESSVCAQNHSHHELQNCPVSLVEDFTVAVRCDVAVARLPSLDGDQTGDDQEREGQYGDLLHETSFTQHSAPHLTSVTAPMSVNNSRECSQDLDHLDGHTSVHNSRECSRDWEDLDGHTSVHNSRVCSRDWEDRAGHTSINDSMVCPREWEDHAGHTSVHNSRVCSRDLEDQARRTAVHNSRACSRDWEERPGSKVVKESKTSWDAFGCGSEFFEDKGKTSHAGSRSWASVASCEPQNNTWSPLWATVSGASSRLEPWDCAIS